MENHGALMTSADGIMRTVDMLEMMETLRRARRWRWRSAASSPFRKKIWRIWKTS